MSGLDTQVCIAQDIKAAPSPRQETSVLQWDKETLRGEEEKAKGLRSAPKQPAGNVHCPAQCPHELSVLGKRFSLAVKWRQSAFCPNCYREGESPKQTHQPHNPLPFLPSFPSFPPSAEARQITKLAFVSKSNFTSPVLGASFLPSLLLGGVPRPQIEEAIRSPL